MKTCQNCNKARATVQITEIDPASHEPRETHLCDRCAREAGASAATVGINPQSIATTLISIQEKVAKARGGAGSPTCDECGMTYHEFRVRGRLGCGRCYEIFEDSLVPLLEKVHGSSQHVGPTPGSDTARERRTVAKDLELIELRRRLSRAVKDEDYEEAARIRDRIRDVEDSLAEGRDV